MSSSLDSNFRKKARCPSVHDFFDLYECFSLENVLESWLREKKKASHPKKSELSSGQLSIIIVIASLVIFAIRSLECLSRANRFSEDRYGLYISMDVQLPDRHLQPAKRVVAARS